MSKIKKLLIGSMLLLLLLQLLFFVLKKEHEIEYSITNNQVTFQIKEIFQKNRYVIQIVANDKTFFFDLPNNTHKQKKILKNILFQQEKEEMCIYPIFEKTPGKIQCATDKQTYTAGKAKMNLKKLKEEMKKNNISLTKPSTKTKKYGPLEVFYENIQAKEYYYIWNYHGFYKITKDTISEKKLLENDQYYNDLGISVANKYLFFSSDEKHSYSFATVIDLVTEKEKVIKFKEPIAKDSYLQGVIENKVYLLDIDHLTQYAFDLEDGSYEIVGNKKKNAIDYVNGKPQRRNIYDFKNKKILFDLTYPLEESEKEEIKESVQSNNNIYYLGKNGQVFLYNTRINARLELTKNAMISTLVPQQEKFCYLEDDMLYCEENGYKYPIIRYKEFKFNKTSRVFIAKE